MGPRALKIRFEDKLVYIPVCSTTLLVRSQDIRCLTLEQAMHLGYFGSDRMECRTATMRLLLNFSMLVFDVASLSCQQASATQDVHQSWCCSSQSITFCSGERENTSKEKLVVRHKHLEVHYSDLLFKVIQLKRYGTCWRSTLFLAGRGKQ